MLRIRQVVCDERHEEHTARHAVTCEEAEDVALSPHSMFERAGGRDEPRYRVLGETSTGRHLLVVIEAIGDGAVVVVTAREMNEAEQRRWRA